MTISQQPIKIKRRNMEEDFEKWAEIRIER